MRNESKNPGELSPPGDGAGVSPSPGTKTSLPPAVNINMNRSDPNIVALTGEDVPALEQYRSLRTKVIKTARLPDKNTIMITSSSSGEGKTITAINLSLTIARGVHENVLLIDCDLRRPDIHKKLGFTAEYGLSHYLKGQVELAAVIHKTNIPKLSIIPAGESLSTSPESLASDRMVKLIRETKSRYADRYIIFDSPPVMPVTDSSVLVEYIDWAIFVIQASHTPRKTVASAISLFNREKILGIVMNDMTVMPREYDFSYKRAQKYGHYVKKK